MFQKVSAKKKIVIVLVRTEEDLEKCDALVIPGGGVCIPSIDVQLARSLSR